MRFLRNRLVVAVLRLLALCALVGLSGVVAGVAVGWPLGRIQLQTSHAVRLDQARLVGSVEPENALATEADLPIGWTAGDPATAAFGILGNEFCGEAVEMPAALSEVKSAVFVNRAGDGTLITQAVRLERWQNAREYVRSVERTVGDCTKFFNNGPDGSRERVDIKEGQGDPPITDFVSRSYVSDDGTGVQYWSIMSVGDVVIGIRYIGATSPQHSLLPDLQNHILMRIAPQDFAPGAGDTRSPDGLLGDGERAGVPSDEIPVDDVQEPGAGDGATEGTPQEGTPQDSQADTSEPIGGDGIGD